MKRIVCASMLIVMLLVLFGGCASNGSQGSPNYGYQGNNGNTTQNTQIKTEPKTVSLNANNIEKYLMFRSEVEDVRIWASTPSGDRANANFTIKTASKQNVEFKNLKVKFKLVPASATKGHGWDTIYIYNDGYKEFEATLEIPYNGNWEETYEITSQMKRYVSENPKFEIVIISAAGQAVEK